MNSKGGEHTSANERTGVITPTEKDRAVKPFAPQYARWANSLKQQKAKKNSSKRSTLDLRSLIKQSSLRKTMRKLRSASAFMDAENVFGKKGGRKSRRRTRRRRDKRRIRK